MDFVLGIKIALIGAIMFAVELSDLAVIKELPGIGTFAGLLFLAYRLSNQALERSGNIVAEARQEASDAHRVASDQYKAMADSLAIENAVLREENMKLRQSLSNQSKED